MLLYTDGLVERRDEDLDAGAARLLGALRETKHLPLAELADTLVLRMRPTDGYRDDVAVLAGADARNPRRSLRRRPRGRAGRAPAAAGRLREWLHVQRLEPTVADDVVLAVGEASANACDTAATSTSGRASPSRRASTTACSVPR